MASASAVKREMILAENANFAHAVNSKPHLASALNDQGVNFIETDVIISDGCPVLGHDPGHPYDLTLQQLVETWMSTPADAMHGLKLDFKESVALKAALEKGWLKYLPVPILSVGGREFPALMVNADILPADIACRFSQQTLPLQAEPQQKVEHYAHMVEMFKQVLEQRSDVLLSLSWSTGAEGGQYTAEAVGEMMQTVAEIRKAAGVHVHITYPVRASWVRGSWEHLAALLAQDDCASFTVWSNVALQEQELRWIQDTLPHKRTMYDLPPTPT